MKASDMSELKKWSVALKEARESREETPDKGFFSADDLAKELNLNVATTRAKVREAQSQGMVEVRKFRRRVASRILPVNHFRLLTVKKPKN